MRCADLIWVVLLVSTLQPVAGQGIVNQADQELAQSTFAKVKELCSESDRPSFDDGFARLRQVAGQNPWTQVLQRASSTSDLQQQLQQQYTSSALVAIIGPLIAAAVFLFVFCFICWGGCYGWRRCRFRETQRTVPEAAKYILSLALFAFVLGGILNATFGRLAYNRVIDGVNYAPCAAARLLQYTLSGQVKPFFLGMLPLQKQIQELLDNLDPTSAFVAQVDEIVRKTSKVSDAVILASETMGLLRDTVADPANYRPHRAGEDDLFHDCVACSKIEVDVSKALSTLDNSLAAALDAARLHTQRQLDVVTLVDSRSALSATASSLGILKDFLKQQLRVFLTDTAVRKQIDAVLVTASVVTISLLVCIAMLTLSSVLAASSWFFRHEPDDCADSVSSAAMVRFSLYTWCCSAWWGILGLCIGGAISAVSVPLAGGCVVLEDLNGQTFRDVARIVNLNMTGDFGSMMERAFDKCFRPAVTNSNPSLLSMLYTYGVVDNGTGQVSMSQKLAVQMKEQLEIAFDRISQSMANSSAWNIQSSNDILALRTFLSRNRFSDLLIANATDFSTNSLYIPMTFDTRAKNNLTLFWFSSANCNDSTDVQGINSFAASLQNFGPPIRNGSCAMQVRCNSTINTSLGKACSAGNALMELKHALQTESIFRCHLFWADGKICDPLNMVETADGFLNDCFQQDGTLQIHKYQCNLQELNTALQQFDARLAKVLSRLDSVSGPCVDAINVDLRMLLESYLFSPIAAIVNGSNCGFIAEPFQDIIHSTCLLAVDGLISIGDRTIICAGLLLSLAVVFHIAWRVVVDNINILLDNEIQELDPGAEHDLDVLPARPKSG